MNIATSKEYNVLVTPPPVNGSNGHSGYWQATVMDLPNIVEQACSRQEVIQQIQQRLTEVMRHSEIVALTLPASPASATTENEEALRAMGWTHYGVFKDDPEALKLFDEIEEERNRHLCGME